MARPPPDIIAIKKLAAAGETKKAIAACRRRIKKTRDPETLFVLAVLLGQQGTYTESFPLFDIALRQLPDRSDVPYNYGVILQAAGKLADAAAQWRAALAINPEHADALFNLSHALADLEDYPAAISAYESLLKLQPENLRARYNLGNAYVRADQLIDGITCFHQVLVAAPDHVDGWINLGLAQERNGDVEAAIGSLRRALLIEPDNALAHWNLAQALLLDGNWQSGFREYEWRLKRHDGPLELADKEPWMGGPIEDKRLLLHAEQGHGDTIQFLRYASCIAERGGTAIIRCHDSLVQLAGEASGVAAANGFQDPLPAFDLHAPLLSLPYLLDMRSPESVPSAPYLTFPQPMSLLGDAGAFQIGIAWAGNPSHDNDQKRSCAFSDFVPLFSADGVQFHSLQLGSKPAPLSDHDIQDLAPHLTTYQDTAAAMAGLDLVITVDTSVAHLAGALGVPTWILLPFAPDWRWGGSGESTVWYPSVRLFRQLDRNGWGPVIARVVDELSRLN